MGQDMENGCLHPFPGSHSDPHIDIANLSNRRKCDHPPDIPFPDGAYRAKNHPAKSKYKQDIDNLTAADHWKSNDTIKNFDQKNNIALRHQTG